MSCLKLCDSEDCYQSENESIIYDINYDTQKFLKEHCRSWFKLHAVDDICKDCIDNINNDYEGFLELDKYDDLSIGQKYIDSPWLLK